LAQYAAKKVNGLKPALRGPNDGLFRPEA
jgi:hypothetical protein